MATDPRNDEAGGARAGAGSPVPLPRGGVAVIRLSSIGDIVLTEPVVAALRRAYPDAEIGYVVKSRFRDLVAAHPDVTRLHELRGSSLGELRALCGEVRSARYSTVVDLHHNQRSVMLTACCRSSVATTYRKRDPGDAVRVRLGRRPFRVRMRLVTRYLESLRPLGIRADLERPRLFVSGEAQASARNLLLEWGLGERTYAAVAPAALWETKRWPADRFSVVAGRLARERGLDILLVGAATDRSLCEDVLRSVDAGGRRVVNAAGAADLGDVAALLGMARIFLGNDSGPMHMAMARRTPTVAIFGPTDPGQFDFSRDAVVYADLDCSACSFYGTRRCRFGHWDCMGTITSERVLEAAIELMERRPAGDEEAP